MATIKIQTGLRLSEDHYNKLKWISDHEGRTMNNLITQIIRRFLDDYEKKHGPVPEYQDE